MQLKNSFLFGSLLLLTLVAVILRFYEYEPPHDGPAEPIPGYSYALEPRLANFGDKRLKKKVGESDLIFATRVNKVIFNSFYHCNYKEVTSFSELIGRKIYYDSLSIGFISPNRPCGWCHQSSIIASLVLVENGINAIPLGINGHVITLVNFESTDEFDIDQISGEKKGGGWYVFDSDFGVGPFVYGDDMWRSVENHYPEYFRNINQYASAFQKISDDSPYYSLEELKEELAKQEKLLAKIDTLHNLTIIILFSMIFTSLIIKIRLSKGKFF
jgi:hypothetical protein